MNRGKTSYDRRPTTEPPPASEPPRRLESEPPPTLASSPSFVTPPSAADPHHLATLSPPTSDPVTDDSAAELNRPQAAVPLVADFAGDPSAPLDERGSPEAPNRPLKIVYCIVFGALALSVLGLIYIHFFNHTGRGHSTHAEGATTTSLAPQTTTTAPALPTALQPGAEAAATTMVSSWSSGNRAAALTVATPTAVATLFAEPYASEQAIDRGCSTSFTPIVCTFGPAGGASPTEAIYEIDVSQTAGGWYVSSVKIEN